MQSRHRFSTSLFSLALMSAALLTAAHSAPGAQHGDLADRTAAMLGVRSVELLVLDTPAEPGQAFDVEVVLEGETVQLDVQPYSVRADDFQLRAYYADGSYDLRDPGIVRTLRGSITGVEGSIVAGSLLDDGLYLMIQHPVLGRYWLEPIGSRVAGVAAQSHALYRDSDVLGSGGFCMAIPSPDGIPGPPDGGVSEYVESDPDLFIAELACDADYEYFQDYGSVEAVQTQVELVINTMDVQYESEVDITHFITAIVVRTEEDDPYTASDPSFLLGQFSAEWNANMNDIKRDVAELFTGINLDGSVIGVAWVGVVCKNNAFNVVQSDCCASLSCKTDLSAHELGHNWGAGHCSCSNNTMNSGLTCSNAFHPTETVPEIAQYRDNQSPLCLIHGSPLLRILIDGPTEVMENSSAQYNVTALFQLFPDEDVTEFTDLSVIPESAGTIDESALFTAAEVTGNYNITIYGTFTDANVTDEHVFTVTILDSDPPPVLIASDPPSGAIDARQPFELDGSNPTGWNSVELTFDVPLTGLIAGDLTISEEGGDGLAPAVVDITGALSESFVVELDGAIEPGAWTTITHEPSGASVVLGYLPADVSGDGTASAGDVLLLIDAINGQVVLPEYATDIDRSGELTAADVLRVIDLLNGANEYDPYNGVSLP